MSNFSELTEIEDAIVRYLESSSATEADILASFTSKIYPKSLLKGVIHDLSKLRGYVKLSDEPYLQPGVYDLFAETEDSQFEYHYELTPLGKAYLARSTSNFTSYSNISNSNIAHQSSNVKQQIKLSEQPEDIQQKVKELEAAIKEKNTAGIKKAFTYIADKSVDVAIATLTQGLIR